MKYDKKVLEATCNDLRGKYGMNDEATMKEVLNWNVSEKFASFKTSLDTPRAEAEVAAAAAPVNEAIAMYNDLMRLERLDTLKEMKVNDAMKDYVGTQCVSGYKLVSKTDKDTNVTTYTTEAAKVELDAYDFIEAVCPVEMDTILDLCCVFAENLAMFEFKSEQAHIARKGFHDGYAQLRRHLAAQDEKKGREPIWNKNVSELSITLLKKQLDYICKVITHGVSPSMIGADVKFIKNGIINAQSKPDKNGRLTLKNERTLIRFIFRAIFTRKAGAAYSFQAKSDRMAAAPKTYRANEAMGESKNLPEFSKSEQAPAGDVTVSKGKTPAKKSA